MSRATLNRLFRRTMGISFGKFRIRAHLGHAAHLLHTTHLGLTEVATEAGFTDASHLYRMFVKHYGVTPRQYRSRGQPEPASRTETPS